MNEIAMEMLDILMHSGTPHEGNIPHSGRYAWGSGTTPFQHYDDFLGRVEHLRHDPNFSYTEYNEYTGKSKVYKGDTAIAKSMGLSSTEFRTQVTLATHERKNEMAARAARLRKEGHSLSGIADIMGLAGESSVRSLLNENAKWKKNELSSTMNLLKDEMDKKGIINIGGNVNLDLNVSEERLKSAVYALQREGYEVYKFRAPQVTNPGQYTTNTVICPPGTPYKEVYNYDKIHFINEKISHDNGETFDPVWVYPKSLDSKRLQINYATNNGEGGGALKDGVIEIRRGVDDLSLGDSHYSQVRILVDGTHYLKGMAVYADDLPDGVDVRFNTNKPVGTPALGPKGNTVLKPIKKDPENPFGSYIKEGIIDPTDPTKREGGQSYYIDKNGKKQLSLINKRSDEGDWDEWSNKLSSQFLSKQNKDLVKRQLNLALQEKTNEYNDICNYNNPTVKKVMLNTFASDCDSAAVHLKAAALPRQRYQVILPLTTLKDNEVYAPNYHDGETVALIRYPHGGLFEIPILKVNNKNREGKNVISNTPKDAIGINKDVADRLSGADFDGDTVMVIPCNSNRSSVHISSKKQLEGLKGFDPKLQYGGRPEGSFKPMKDTQKQMGVISNLITDMTILGATDDELARAVRHSMVVIDAEKHGLDWKQSEKDNNIKQLKQKYQQHIGEDGKVHYGGASTLISKAKSVKYTDKVKGQPRVNQKGKPWYNPKKPEGALLYNYVKETYIDKNGKVQERQRTSTKMAETDDANTLLSRVPNPQELYYAQYANHMKALANKARKEMVYTKDQKYDPNAAKVYKDEVYSLNNKLNISKRNQPRENKAQLLAQSRVQAKIKGDPSLKGDKKALKKLRQMELVKARTEVGASRISVDITDKEWEAIQAHAISANKLKEIMLKTDQDKLKERVMPRSTNQTIPQAKISKIQSMKNLGYTTAEIADAVGVSVSTVRTYLKGKE